jgi:hypothetical protein
MSTTVNGILVKLVVLFPSLGRILKQVVHSSSFKDVSAFNSNLITTFEVSHSSTALIMLC